jgi:hypothetical protein
MTDMRSAGTLGDLLASRRQRRFVGRASEVELFRVALDSPEPPFLLLHIHGPPGIGTTRLLDIYAGLAADAGASVVRLDGRDLLPSPPAVLQALAGVLEVPEGEGAIAGLSDSGRLVVLVDTYERLAPLDDWVRTRLLPRLPATALTVVAGRVAPGSAWRADPAWRELLRVVSLRNLSPEDSRQYLHACGVEPGRHDQLVELAHGHPLGLSLLADVVVRGGEAAADPLTPDLVGTLLRRFVEIVPSGLHRHALEVCALARVTTEALLREVLGLEDAHELFTWLRELSFMESGPEGVYPHDLARDALEADLRWRDRDGYRRVFRGIRGHIHGRLQTSRGHEQQRAISDAKYLFRRLPGVLSPVDWDAWGQQYPEPARPADREPILELVLATGVAAVPPAPAPPPASAAEPGRRRRLRPPPARWPHGAGGPGRGEHDRLRRRTPRDPGRSPAVCLRPTQWGRVGLARAHRERQPGHGHPERPAPDPAGGGGRPWVGRRPGPRPPRRRRRLPR